MSLQSILSDKLGIKPSDKPHAVPASGVPVPMPGKLHAATVRLSSELGMSHEAALAMLFDKMQLSVDVALEAVLHASAAKREISALTATHAKALHAASMQVSQALGQPVQVM
jgi:hypothetical protein